MMAVFLIVGDGIHSGMQINWKMVKILLEKEAFSVPEKSLVG